MIWERFSNYIANWGRSTPGARREMKWSLSLQSNMWGFEPEITRRLRPLKTVYFRKHNIQNTAAAGIWFSTKENSGWRRCVGQCNTSHDLPTMGAGWVPYQVSVLLWAMTHNMCCYDNFIVCSDKTLLLTTAHSRIKLQNWSRHTTS